jgi:general secretion pathway protein G
MFSHCQHAVMQLVHHADGNAFACSQHAHSARLRFGLILVVCLSFFDRYFMHKKLSFRPALAQNLHRGFTLIEIMVVVVIMGILAALVVPKLMGRADDARITAAKQDIATLMSALKLYKLDNQRYPTTEQGLQALIAKPTTGPAASGWKQGGYVDKLPKDPWGNPYQYLSPGVKGEVDVFSYGADGQPGGTGNDADIGSWDL